MFDNGSSVSVGVSVRGLTFQNLHISELGRIARYFPLRAEEIRTGALNTVHSGQMIFIESTAEGRQGLLYELVERADQLRQEDRPLTKLDFKLHFYPWYLDDRYALSDEDTARVDVTAEDKRYFAAVEAEMEAELSPGQKAWYVAKRATQGEKMKQEYPSTPKEPFEVSNEGKIFRREMEAVRRDGRIVSRVPVIGGTPVNTFWDLGHDDYTAIWFCQRVGPENRMLRYYRNAGYGLAHYIECVKSHGYFLGKFYFPHDAEHKRIAGGLQGKSIVDYALECGLTMREIEVVPRVEDKWVDGIGACRNVFPSVVFDRENCEQGIKDLDNYRKIWNDKVGAWHDYPAHDDASHGADAFETFARSEAATRGSVAGRTTARRNRTRNWRLA